MPPIVTAETRKLFPQHLLDLAVVIIILLIGYVYTYGIENVLDIGLWDESAYLYRGLQISDVGLPRAQNAPLYAVWYYLLSFFQADAIKLYFLNYKLMTVLPALMLFVALRAFRVSRLIALVMAAAFIFNYVNFPTWPKVSHFAVFVLLCGFFLSAFVRETWLQTCILLVTALLVSYIRPEFFLSFICLALLLAFLSFRNVKSSRSLRPGIPLLASLLPCIVVIIWLGQPMASGNRSMVAFGQHYANNWVKTRHDEQNNSWTDWQGIVAADFGTAHTPIKALLNNPGAIMQHVSQNIKLLPEELGVMLNFRYLSGHAAKIAFAAGLLALVTAGAVFVRYHELTQARKHLADNWSQLRFRAILLFIILLPVIITSFAIAPRRHYVYIFGALLIFGLATLLFRNTEESKGHSGYSAIALLCLALLLTTHPVSSLVKVTDQPNLNTIKYLRSLHLGMPIRMLESDGGYYIYTGKNYKQINIAKKDRTFSDFLTEESINMLVVSDRLAQDNRFRNDAQWHAFTNNPSQFGFTQLVIPDVTTRSLFVSKAINKQLYPAVTNGKPSGSY